MVGPDTGLDIPWFTEFFEAAQGSLDGVGGRECLCEGWWASRRWGWVGMCDPFVLFVLSLCLLRAGRE